MIPNPSTLVLSGSDADDGNLGNRAGKCRFKSSLARGRHDHRGHAPAARAGFLCRTVTGEEPVSSQVNGFRIGARLEADRSNPLI